MPITNRNKCMQFRPKLSHPHQLHVWTKFSGNSSSLSTTSLYFLETITRFPSWSCVFNCLIIKTLLKFLFLSLTLQSIVMSHSVQTWACGFFTKPICLRCLSTISDMPVSLCLDLMLVWPHLWIMLWSWLFDI